jgi:hypothetical protein
MVTGPALKHPGHEADTPVPSNAEVKNEYSYTSTPLYTFMAWTGTAYPFSPNIMMSIKSRWMRRPELSGSIQF